MNFENALSLMKEGMTLTRKGWYITDISIRCQFPDENSMNTLPYIVMIKEDNTFPTTLSPESIFAEDWTICEEFNKENTK